MNGMVECCHRLCSTKFLGEGQPPQRETVGETDLTLKAWPAGIRQDTISGITVLLGMFIERFGQLYPEREWLACRL